MVQFPGAERERLIWTCGCGCCTMFLHEDGSAECPSCGVMAEGNWVPPPEAKRVPVEATVTHKIGEPVDVTDKIFTARMSDPDLAAAVQFFRDGRVSSVIRTREVEDVEGRAWWRRQVATFLKQLFIQ